MTRAVGDMKAGLTGSRPKMSILPRAGMIYGVRPLEYGAAKYARGNYYGQAPEGVSAVDRYLGYLDAAMRHIARVTEAVNRAKGTGGDQVAACAVVDADGGGKFPASDLPDVAHAIASLLLAVTCAVEDGVLPEDPGQPWVKNLAPEVGLPQKDDPAAERARVEALQADRLAALNARRYYGQEADVKNRIGGVAADLTPGESDIRQVVSAIIAEQMPGFEIVNSPFPPARSFDDRGNEILR